MENAHEITTVLWDGDNTAWSWMEYAVPAYEAMCQKIAQMTGMTLEQTAEAMKAYYAGKGTLEDEGLMQGLAVAGHFDHIPGLDLHSMIGEVQHVFSGIRLELLRAYPGIKDTMAQIYRRGDVFQALLTDAPDRQAQMRLDATKLYPYIHRVFAMPSAQVSNVPEQFLHGSRKDLFRPSTTVSAQKPHTDLEQILGMTREEISRHVAIVGDNFTKDMGLAMAYGCRGIHAAYGLSNSDLVQRISVFAPPHVAHRNMETGDGHHQPSNISRIQTANTPSEIYGLLFPSASS